MPRKQCSSLVMFGGLIAGLALLAVGLSGQSASTAQPSTKNGEWPTYNADLRGTRFSPLEQINGDVKAGSLTVAAGSRMRGQVEFGYEGEGRAKAETKGFGNA